MQVSCDIHASREYAMDRRMTVAQDPFVALREFLDRFPLGFPATDSGIEMEILKRLFSEEEARAAVLLTPFPEPAPAIAVRAGRDPRTLAVLLEAMSYRGLVFRSVRGGEVRYNAAPFMIGIYEYSVGRLDPGLASLYARYYELAYQKEMGASNIPGFKAVPVDEAVAHDLTALPCRAIEEEIRSARKIAVAECICRKEARLTGHGCAHELETCLSFGVAAEYYIANGIGREIGAGEALAILRRADEAGLVHASSNVKHLSNICNCCPCCCASMKGMTCRGHDREKYFNPVYEPVVSAPDCTACGTCRDRCPVSAITMADAPSFDRDRCLGCGLCATACPARALSMIPRQDGSRPYERMLDLGMAILTNKKRTGDR